MINRIISYVFAATGTFLIITGRVLSVDLTEGQAFIQYWWIWCLAILCLLSAVYAASIGSEK